MAEGKPVSIHLEHAIGERMISMTLSGRLDDDGTFHGIQPGRGGQELIIPNAQNLVVAPQERPAAPPAASTTG